MTYCKNCGSPSHCGVPLYSQGHFNLKDELAPSIRICNGCRCENCNKLKTCFICKEEKYNCIECDYRDYKDELKGRIQVCQNCWDRDK